MPKELPIAYPIKNNEERILIVILIAIIMLLTFGVLRLTPERKNIIAKIPVTETDAAFVIDEVYNKTTDIDLLLLGPCTVWWQIYTPYLQERLSEKYQRQAEVLTLGYNHFGSDLMYLLLKDILQKRQVKNLLITLPKVEDLYDFPHKNAVSWWLYPNDLEGVTDLSIQGYLRVLGLNLFSSIYHSSLKNENLSFLTSTNTELGFNSLREPSRLDKHQLPKINSSEFVKIVSVDQTDLDANNLLSSDWIKFYDLLFKLVTENHINLVIVDSPHVIEFEENTPTIPGNFPQLISAKQPIIEVDFKKWLSALPENLRYKVYNGHNLTTIGAQIFTDLIKDHVIEQLQ